MNVYQNRICQMHYSILFALYRPLPQGLCHWNYELNGYERECRHWDFILASGKSWNDQIDVEFSIVPLSLGIP